MLLPQDPCGRPVSAHNPSQALGLLGDCEVTRRRRDFRANAKTQSAATEAPVRLFPPLYSPPPLLLESLFFFFFVTEPKQVRSLT